MPSGGFGGEVYSYHEDSCLFCAPKFILTCLVQE